MDNPHAECWRRDQQSRTDLLRAYEQVEDLRKIVQHYRDLAERQAAAIPREEDRLNPCEGSQDICDVEREALLARLDRAELERVAAQERAEELARVLDAVQGALDK